MLGVTMSKRVSNPPWGISIYFSFFTFFTFFTFFYFFSTYIYKTHPPLYFMWNYDLHKNNTLRFSWNNSISTKNKKEERTLILNPYLNLFARRCD